MSSIVAGGRRIRAVDRAWHPDGRWMIVWDGDKYPRLRKVACVLPKELGVEYPVYAYGGGSYDYGCWANAGEIPPGCDVSGIDGYEDMQRDKDL
jgi:hypothetical protein